MTTDKTPATLATAKHGGCVQLRDGLLPCPFCGNGAEFVPYKNNGLTLKCKSMGCIQRHQRTLLYGIEWLRTSMTEHWNARALSAQPSPAVEGDAYERDRFEAWHREKFKTRWQTGAPTRDMHNGVYADNYGPAEQQERWELWQAISAAISAQAGQGDALLREVSAQLESLDCGACIGSDAPMEDLHGRIAAHLAARQPVGERPLEMRICELRHVSLKPNRPYVFTVDANCAKCRADAAYALGHTDTKPAQAVDLGPAVIPDTPEVRDILGRPNFWCSPWANVLRMRGDTIPRKAEEEQAAVIRFMLNHYLAHGAAWAETAGAELDAIRKDESKEVAP
ncbi:hypothetical protein I5U25_02565 [Stenotrophomonas maltophilia]|nr:hypothetical protein [Stenotrophomonas maltophilia]